MHNGGGGSHIPGVIMALLEGEKRTLAGYFDRDVKKQVWCRYMCQLALSTLLPGDLEGVEIVGKVGKLKWRTDESKSSSAFVISGLAYHLISGGRLRRRAFLQFRAC